MLLYEYIKTESQFLEFIETLNQMPHYERYLLFNHVFETALLDLRPKGFPHTRKKHYQQWMVKVGGFIMFTTVKINPRLSQEFPEYKTGAYEHIYFHHLRDDLSGISQN